MVLNYVWDEMQKQENVLWKSNVIPAFVGECSFSPAFQWSILTRVCIEANCLQQLSKICKIADGYIFWKIAQESLHAIFKDMWINKESQYWTNIHVEHYRENEVCCWALAK